jgi:hypothetical protein
MKPPGAADIARDHVTEPFLALCRRHGLMAKLCKQNLLNAP